MTSVQTRHKAEWLLDMLRRQESDGAAVVLIGSAARDVGTERSDVDFLVVRPEEGSFRIKPSADVNVHQETRRRFLERLARNEDFPAWALRYGVPIRDPDGWWSDQVSREERNPHWPDWRAKIVHGEKRLRMAGMALEDGDMEAAAEELLFAASHAARAVLLKSGVFPLSRPELPAQLEGLDDALSRALSGLIEDNLGTPDLERTARLIEERLAGLGTTAVSVSAS